MKLVTWNVNSINARQEHVRRYINENAPDILMLQELKGLDFPTAAFTDMGYHSHAALQKAYNGVAILSRTPIHVVSEALPGDPEDGQARYLEVEITGMRLINIYLPNGNPAPGDKYDYKLRWMERLYNRVKALTDQDTPFIIGGDFNVIPEEKDCRSPKDWEEDALFRIETRSAFRSLLNKGLIDCFRVFHGDKNHYTFWDYQVGAWQKNNGIRIDHFLASPYYVDRLRSCSINTAPRGWDKPSDHTPVELVL